MKDIDSLIRDALTEEDVDLIEGFEAEPSIFEQIGQTFKGRMRWLVVWVYFAMFALTGVGIFCVVQLLNTKAEAAIMRWGTGVICSVVAIYALKVWYWMELNKNTLTREIKRLELQVARLSNELREHRQ